MSEIKESFVATTSSKNERLTPLNLLLEYRLESIFGEILAEDYSGPVPPDVLRDFRFVISTDTPAPNSGNWQVELSNYECSHYSAVLLSKRMKRISLLSSPSLEIVEKLVLDIVGRVRYDMAYASQTVFDYPPAVQIEVSKACNLRCSFCYQSNKDFSNTITRSSAFIDRSFYENVINSLKYKVPYLIIASRGEPTMHPNFNELLSYANGSFLDIKLNTNGMFLTKDVISTILDTVDTLVISIDSNDPLTYEDMRKNASHQKLMNNLHLLKQMRINHPRCDDITIRISGVVCLGSIKTIMNILTFIHHLPMMSFW